MDIQKRKVSEIITDHCTSHYKLITIVMVLSTLALGTFISFIKIDTDPENMLSKDNPVRVFHNETKKAFNLSDIVVVGIVNDKDPNGVFNPASLARIYELTQYAETLRWPNPEDASKTIGVIEADLLAPSTVDYIGQGQPGEVKFEWLMSKPPKTGAEALQIRAKAMSNPLLRGTVVSENGRALCLYLPLTSKDLSHRVYLKLREKIATFKGDEQYYITGLPVAEDTFGVEMFMQMAISAPLAMATIFVLMFLFFRKLILIISPMIVAIVSVLSTMGLLIAFGYPVHIMSSMIPIFLMPISVVDSIHILSEFFDRYTPQKGRKGTIIEVMKTLYTPMLYTSLTSAAGFASLALTPIPPVQIFGIFVAVGIMIAWLWTVVFVPAYTMMINENRLRNFGLAAASEEKQTWLTKLLFKTGSFTYRQAKLIIAAMVLVSAIAVYGVTQIQINDNPVKWFAKSHPIRQADIELNKHFGGTYMAYLVLDDAQDRTVSKDFVEQISKKLAETAAAMEPNMPGFTEIAKSVETIAYEKVATVKTQDQLLDTLSAFANKQAQDTKGSDSDIWYEVASFFDLQKENLKIFKQPAVLNYIAQLQEYLKQSGLVGKSSSVTDVVRKVYQELTNGKSENYIVPDSSPAVAQCLLQFQSSHKPNDLWHLVTYDYMHANIWLQLKSGDNKDMEAVVKKVSEFFDTHKPPVPLKYSWAGLTYINTVWQDKMVWGMLQSFLGSFIIVFIMMAVLFRSILWGLVCMIPLTVTIAMIYGIIGLVGKDYDMPVAVLSALTLGMAVDFAIHFLERARESYRQSGSWEKAAPMMFGEPARAISRNVLVIAIGFLPLLAAPLVPYKTVGIFVCAIMGLSGIVTLIVLPAILRIGEKKLFKSLKEPVSPSCNCVFCLVISVAATVLVAINLHQNWNLGLSKLTWFSIIAIALMTLVCGVMSRRKACRNLTEKKEREV